MENRQAAQAIRLVGALRAQLEEMIAQLARVERKAAAARSGSAVAAMRTDAAMLRRDIDEAQMLIDRLQRRYLSGKPGAGPVAPREARWAGYPLMRRTGPERCGRP